jgi:hypothetical protein
VNEIKLIDNINRYILESPTSIGGCLLGQSKNAIKRLYDENKQLLETVESLRCCGNCEHAWEDSEGIMLCKLHMPSAVHGKCGLWAKVGE